MERVRLGSLRGPIAAIAALVVMATPVAAWASSAPEPVITSAPGRVGLGRGAVIGGRLDGGDPGQSVQLERWLPATGWRRIAARVTNENNTVWYRLNDLRRSAGYRLVHRDPATGDLSRSGSIRIGVGVRLRMYTSTRHVVEGRRVRVHGTLFPARSGRRVVLEQRVAGAWRWVARLGAGDGSFSTRFSPGAAGHRRLRVRFRGDEHNRGGIARRAIRVYEPGLATWYGPGLYGNRTACGGRLGYDTLGVAHRSLPCGTKVNILYRGRTITVPVIDRGPYSSADWDLTEETAERLRFSGKDRIGTHR